MKAILRTRIDVCSRVCRQISMYYSANEVQKLLELHMRSLYGVDLHMHPIAQPYTSLFTVGVSSNKLALNISLRMSELTSFGAPTGGARQFDIHYFKPRQSYNGEQQKHRLEGCGKSSSG